MSDGKDKSTELAEDRTDWAEDRTVLANERTFAGWMRTALGCLGIALAMHALFRALDPTWLGRAVALLFCVIAAVVIVTARVAATKMLGRLNCHSAEPVDGNQMNLIAGCLLFACAAVAVVLIVV
jgi:putative membrane protein